MKKLLIASVLLMAVASVQAGNEIYWEGKDSWNGNIGSTDYIDGNAWSDINFNPYGFPGPQDGDVALIANWGAAGTAATQPILSTATTGVPKELRLGGDDGTLGTLDIISGGSVTVAQLGISILAHGDGILTITNGASMTVTNGLVLGMGGFGTINLTGGSFSLNAFADVGGNGIVNLSTNATFTLPGDMTGLGYVSYCNAIDASSVLESYDAGADLTTIYASDDVAQAPGPVWQDPVTASDAVVAQDYADTLEGKAIDEHDDPITFEKIDGPDWLTVWPGGALGGTPLSVDLGTNTFTVSATDGVSIPDETTLTIVVGANPGGLEISINFDFNDQNPLEGTDLMFGPLHSNSTNWNSSYVFGSPYESGVLASNLVDSSGAATTAGISYSASAVNFVAEATDERDRLNLGFLDATGPEGLFIAVSNIPYASYTVYGIVGGDPSGTHSTDTNLWQVAMKSLDFQVNELWVYGGATTGAVADVYTTLHASRVGGNAEYEEWVEIVPGSVTGMYWAVEASGPTLTIQGQPGVDVVTRGALAGIIIKEHVTAGPAQDLSIKNSVDGMVLSWTGEAEMPYGVDTNINLVIPDNWGRWETGLMNPTGGVISVTNAIGVDEIFYRVISE